MLNGETQQRSLFNLFEAGGGESFIRQQLSEGEGEKGGKLEVLFSRLI